MFSLIRFLFISFIVSVGVHGVGSGGPGSTAASTCGGVTSCARAGTSNYMSRSLSYDTSTGFFSGSFTSNSCPEFEIFKFNGVAEAGQGPQYTATCYTQPIPANGYVGVSFPRQAPTRGVSGFTISGGSDIYGPMEAGFAVGQACSNNKGSCPAGVDVPTCASKLQLECGVSNWRHQMFADDCGGHAFPYHVHTDIRCTKSGYSGVAITGQHSPLIGVMLDGRGLYGLYESGSSLPTDLDACGGHYGPVPATNVTVDSYPAASNVYHYHTQPVAPYVPSCFGPVTSLAACKALYTQCSSTSPASAFCTTRGRITYQYDCPCFQHMPSNQTFNQEFDLNANCTENSNGNGASIVSSTLASFICLVSFFAVLLQ
jgi:hypothetical protein